VGWKAVFNGLLTKGNAINISEKTTEERGKRENNKRERKGHFES